MTYAEALDYLLALPRFADAGAGAYRPGLERVEALLDAMGRPHDALRSIHVAGTNGKGSTASMLAAIGTAAGYRVGLHTSPHLFHLAERMRLDGVPAPEDWLAAAVARYRPAMEAIGPSFFEATVALSLHYFAEEGVDWAVVEVGLGGRLDATNVLQPALAVITNVGLDHTDVLGATHAAVAREKAGIVKPGVPVLTGVDAPEAREVIRDVAAARGARLHDALGETTLHDVATSPAGLTLGLGTPVRRYEALAVDLPGLHQAANARLAVRAAELCFAAARRAAAPVRTGLAAVRRLSGLRGRLDVLHTAPLVVADVGHNAEGLEAALAFVQSSVAGRGARLFVLFGAMRDKDVHRMARLLAEARAAVVPVRLESPRALAPVELGHLLSGYGIEVIEAGPLPEGLAHLLQIATPDDALLVTGSHQVVAQLAETDLYAA